MAKYDDGEDKLESHKSYGFFRLDRRTVGGKGASLFGSSIKHTNIIALSIGRAKRRRCYHQYSHYPEEKLVEVELSASQLADALFTFNHHEGAPCTIKYVGREAMPECPEYSQREMFEDELKKKLRGAMEQAQELVKQSQEILQKKTILKADREDLLGRLHQLSMNIGTNMAFVQSQFNEAMERTVQEVKMEISAHANSVLTSLGMDALHDKISIPSIDHLSIAHDKGCQSLNETQIRSAEERPPKD